MSHSRRTRFPGFHAIALDSGGKEAVILPVRLLLRENIAQLGAFRAFERIGDVYVKDERIDGVDPAVPRKLLRPVRQFRDDQVVFPLRESGEGPGGFFMLVLNLLPPGERFRSARPRERL